MLKKVTDERTVSSFFISIGTALALEALFEPNMDPYDPERKIIKIDVNKYEKHYLNALTLIRNIVSSIDTVNKEALFNDMHVNSIILDTLTQELFVINELYESVKTEPILFIPDYMKLKGNILHKTPSVPPSRREMLDNISTDVLLLLKKHVKNNKLPISVVSNTHLLPRSNNRTLITTHVSMDLNNIGRVPNLELLESYTGVLKDKRKFNTKYPKVGKEDLSRLPFTEELSYILGDSVLTKSRGIKIKREILELATKNRWNPLTSASTVRFAISKMLNVDGKPFKFKKIY